MEQVTEEEGQRVISKSEVNLAAEGRCTADRSPLPPLFLPTCNGNNDASWSVVGGPAVCRDGPCGELSLLRKEGRRGALRRRTVSVPRRFDQRIETRVLKSGFQRTAPCFQALGFRLEWRM